MAVLQVRNMDDMLYETLGRRAAMENRSISQQVIEIIQRYLSSPDSFNTTCPDDAMLSLIGSWEDDRSADEIIADIRNSRTKNTHRFKGDIF